MSSGLTVYHIIKAWSYSQSTACHIWVGIINPFASKPLLISLNFSFLKMPTIRWQTPGREGVRERMDGAARPSSFNCSTPLFNIILCYFSLPQSLIWSNDNNTIWSHVLIRCGICLSRNFTVTITMENMQIRYSVVVTEVKYWIFHCQSPPARLLLSSGNRPRLPPCRMRIYLTSER